MKIKRIITVLFAALTLASCAPAAKVIPTEMAVATPTITIVPPTISHTPTIISSPTPMHINFQGATVPINVYLDDKNCITLELGGKAQCVNMFVLGKAGENHFQTEMTWRGTIYIIGDVNAKSIIIEPGTVIYIGANFDSKNLHGKGDDVGCSDSETRAVYKGTKGECGLGLIPGDPHWDEANHISLNIANLISIGTENTPILITSSASKPTMYDWNYLDFAGRIEYTFIEYGRAIGIKDKSTISNSTIAHIGGCNVCSGENARDITISNNHFFDAGHELIDTHSAFNSVVITGNELEATRYVGIIIDGGSPKITGNIIHDTFTGILFLNEPNIKDLVISENTFYQNRHHWDCNGDYSCALIKDLILLNNFFK